MDATFETPEDYDLDVLEWAAWRALRNWDLDAEDRTKADQHKQAIRGSEWKSARRKCCARSGSR
jgi:hypothetical protein